MSIQGYAKYLMSEAVDSLRGPDQGIPPRVNRFAVDFVGEAGGDFVIDVRYLLRDESFLVRSRWRAGDEGWGDVHAERLWSEGESRPGSVSRLLSRLLGGLARRRR
ncbi:MAG TPA: hypothetical protein VMR52_06150 [Dehalococcoidia bacterium]|nr:hypothetical protein [Dehalococcoidia bacterium]